FATTALVATAGVAMADVAISGYAEMGIAGGGDDAINGTGGVSQFFQDIDVTFTMSGTTDNGLTFGAGVDIDETAAGTNSFDDNGTTVFISGDFGTLTMGDTDGALDFVITENFGNPGSIDDSETLHAGYLGSFLDGLYDGQILRYDYSFDAFTFAVSVEMDDADIADAGYAIGVGYDMAIAGGSVALGLGYQSANVVGAAASANPVIDNDPTSPTFGDPIADVGGSTVELANLGDYGIVIPVAAGDSLDIEAIAFSAGVTLDSGFTGGVMYNDWDIEGTDVTHMAISAGYTFDAISVGANYGIFELDGTDASGFGLAASYDLGGGASIHAAYGDSDIDGVDGDFQSWSLGLAMSF
ncbi:porin, partial [Roseibacterium sp. SDUM158017]|uniref:porin n=1 Tax=Roseicyclus salinarum TaxID=3036773 RepID=UPI00241564AB